MVVDDVPDKANKPRFKTIHRGKSRYADKRIELPLSGVRKTVNKTLTTGSAPSRLGDYLGTRRAHAGLASATNSTCPSRPGGRLVLLRGLRYFRGVHLDTEGLLTLGRLSLLGLMIVLTVACDNGKKKAEIDEPRTVESR